MDEAHLADLVATLHLCYVLFVIGGLLAVLAGAARGWGWVRNRAFRIVHLVCTVVVPVLALADLACPLTSWERLLRRRAGQSVESISFFGRIVRAVFYVDAPEWALTVGYVVFGSAVVAAFFLVPPRPRRR